MPRRLTSRQIARQFGISPAEARRHAVRGTLPGRPGKADERDAPAPPVEPAEKARPPLLPPLNDAISAVAQLALAEEFDDEDMDALEQLIVAAQRVLAEWREIAGG